MSFRKKRKTKLIAHHAWVLLFEAGEKIYEKKEKQERILQRSRRLASSGFVITMEADTFPLLIWWDEVCSRGEDGRTQQKWSKLCRTLSD